jgi:hypothetical protein
MENLITMTSELTVGLDVGDKLTLGKDCDLRRWGLSKAQGGKRAKKRAVVAVARKLAVLLHRLMLTGEVYESNRVTAAHDRELTFLELAHRLDRLLGGLL